MMLARLILVLIAAVVLTAVATTHFQTVRIIDLRQGCADANGNLAGSV